MLTDTVPLLLQRRQIWLFPFDYTFGSHFSYKNSDFCFKCKCLVFCRSNWWAVRLPLLYCVCIETKSLCVFSIDYTYLFLTHFCSTNFFELKFWSFNRWSYWNFIDINTVFDQNIEIQLKWWPKMAKNLNHWIDVEGVKMEVSNHKRIFEAQSNYWIPIYTMQ